MTKFEIYKRLEKEKFKYIIKKYPECKHIFGKRNNAPSFLTCDISHAYYIKSYNKYNKLCTPIEKVYQDLVYSIACLINEIKPNPNIDEIMYIYIYLYTNGYLSANNIFTFDIPEKEAAAKKQLCIFNGKGVCRNIATLLIDIYNYFGIKSFGIITDHYTYPTEPIVVEANYADIIDQKVNSFDEKFQEITKYNNISTGTHYEIITNYKGLKLVDPTNGCTYNITNKENKYPALNMLRPWYLYATGKHNINQTEHIYKILKNKYLKMCKGDYYFSLQHNCYNLCKNNKVKILEFRKTYNNHINFLSDCVEKINS